MIASSGPHSDYGSGLSAPNPNIVQPYLQFIWASLRNWGYWSLSLWFSNKWQSYVTIAPVYYHKESIFITFHVCCTRSGYQHLQDFSECSDNVGYVSKSIISPNWISDVYVLLSGEGVISIDKTLFSQACKLCHWSGTAECPTADGKRGYSSTAAT